MASPAQRHHKEGGSKVQLDALRKNKSVGKDLCMQIQIYGQANCLWID